MYYLVNVPGKYGYSFMVSTELEDEQDILDRCLEMDLFDDENDYDEANVSEADEYDQEAFEDFYDIDD